MKKGISILLSIALLSSFAALFGVQSAAAGVRGLSYTPQQGIVLYEGYETHEEHDFIDGQDVTYTYYDIGHHLFQNEGDVITVYYDDDTSEAFTYTEVPDENDPNRSEWKYHSEQGNDFDLFQTRVESVQSYENQWSAGGTYTAYFVYEGKKARFSVEVKQNPVENVTVAYEHPLTLLENVNGSWEHDAQTGEDWFNYWDNSQYWRKAGISLQVEYTDGTHDSFAYRQEQEWVLTNQDGVQINERYFGIRTDQWQTHFKIGETASAFIGYYGKGEDIPLQVLPFGDIDEGELYLDTCVPVLTYTNEWHHFSFTPFESGMFALDNSLADKIRCGGFSCRVTADEQEIAPVDDRNIAFMLKGGQTYTLSVRNNNEDEVRYEKLEVHAKVGITAIAFTPAQPLTAYAGDVYDSNMLYRAGNRIEVSFSDGETITFVCNHDNDYISEDGREMLLEDVAREHGVEDDCRPYGIPSAEPWQADEAASLEIAVGTARQTVAVEVLTSPYSEIVFQPATPLTVYDGTQRTDWGENAQGEWVEYTRFDIDKWNLQKEGNRFIITDTNGDTHAYNFVWKEIDVGGYTENKGYFEAGNGDSFAVEDLIVTDDQGPDNLWQPGEEHYLQLYFKGQHISVPVQVSESPVQSVQVSVDGGSLILHENIGGHFEYNDEMGREVFRYDDQRDYLRAQNVRITVTFSDKSTKTYTFKEYNWTPTDETGEEIEEDQFRFDFGDQWQHPLDAENDENTAYVTYYGKKASVPVQIVPAGTAVDEGALPVDTLARLYFYMHENHVLHFNIEQAGVYRFEEGLGWDMTQNTGYSFDFTDAENQRVEPLPADNEGRLFALEPGNYTLRISYDAPDDWQCHMEYFRLMSCNVVRSIAFTPAIPAINVVEGDFGGGEIFREGNQITVTLSGGFTDTFTFTDGRFLNAGGMEINDLGWQYDLAGDSSVWAEGNTETWQAEGEAYLIIHCGFAAVTYPVSVSASAVENIVYNPAKPLEILDYELWYKDWENRTEFHGDPFRPGDTISVLYNDERGMVTYRYDGDRCFKNANYAGDEIWLDYRFDEAREYLPGDTVNFTLSYQSGKANLPAAVVESDVQSISFEPETVERAKEFDGSFKTIQVYDPATDSMVPTQVFIYNELPSVLEPGNALTVEYKNGAKKRFVSDGRDFVNAQGETLDMYYLHTFSDQMMIPWRDGVDNPLYINYKGAECLAKVKIIARDPWNLYTKAWVGDKAYENGDTVYIEPGKDIFMSFETDDRNMANGVAPFVGFSDGFEEGTLKQAGFVTQSGTAEQLGFDDDDVFGLQIGTGELPVGAEGTLHLYLYELPEDFDMSHFDFANTPLVAEYTLTVRVSDHRYAPVSVAPTCTEQGYEGLRCEICGDTLKQSFIPALGHDFTQKIMKPYALRTPGSEDEKPTYYYTCVRCGEISKEEDLYFTEPAGAICGQVDMKQVYRDLHIALWNDTEQVAEQTVTPEDSGAFTFNALFAGSYTIRISSPGAAALLVTGITVTEGQTASLADSTHTAVQSLAVVLGDVNADNIVDMADVSLLLADGVYGNAYPNATEDLNDDGITDIRDIAILLAEDNYAGGIQTLTY